MKMSELYDIWRTNSDVGFGMQTSYIISTLLGGDNLEVNTTPELIELSKRVEFDNKTFVAPPETCTSCNGEGFEWGTDLAYGHRPNWYVCAQCKTVLPCSCHRPDARGNPEWRGYPSEGVKCTQCGLKLSDLILAVRREQEALTAVKLRKWERMAAEQEVEFQRTGPHPDEETLKKLFEADLNETSYTGLVSPMPLRYSP